MVDYSYNSNLFVRFDQIFFFFSESFLANKLFRFSHACPITEENDENCTSESVKNAIYSLGFQTIFKKRD